MKDDMTDEERDQATYVLIMADYSSDGIWYKDGCMMCHENLPISDALRTRLEDWCKTYDMNCKDYYGQDEKGFVPFDYITFSAIGLEIAKAIKAELPHWTVFYHDEDKAHDGQNWRDVPRSVYEYEIK